MRIGGTALMRRVASSVPHVLSLKKSSVMSAVSARGLVRTVKKWLLNPVSAQPHAQQKTAHGSKFFL